MLELEDTIEMMKSDDYKERFRAEYLQTKIRCRKLHEMIIKYRAGALNFTPACPYKVLEDQYQQMTNYLDILEIRALIEKVDLMA